MNKRYAALLALSLAVAGCIKPVASEKPPAAVAPPAQPAEAPAQPAETPEPVADGIIPTTNYPSIMTDAFAQVNLADGVSDEEAAVLAEAYFMGYVTGCGMIGDVTDRGEKWEVATFIDYSHTPYHPIRITKKTGRIMCAEGPVVDPPPKP